MKGDGAVEGIVEDHGDIVDVNLLGIRLWLGGLSGFEEKREIMVV